MRLRIRTLGLLTSVMILSFNSFDQLGVFIVLLSIVMDFEKHCDFCGG